MNKKAVLGMNLKTIIGLIMGVIMLLFVFNVGDSIIGILFPDISELTEKSLEGLDNLIQTTSSGQKEDYLFFMSNGFQLVAFDKGTNEKSGDYERPASCFQKSCLVVCKKSSKPNACENSDLIKTYDFDKIIPTSVESGIITMVQKEYVNLEVEVGNNSIKITEKDK